MDPEIKKEFEDLTEIVRGAFDIVEERMATKDDLRQLEEKMATKEDLKQLRMDMGQMKLDLIDAMADKNAELRGDLIILMRKEDTKVINLVELLKRKTVITDGEAKMILTMEPFPRLFV